MPLNEAGVSRSHLTRQQRQAALAAIYGVPDDLSEADVEKIRRQLAGDGDKEDEDDH